MKTDTKLKIVAVFLSIQLIVTAVIIIPKWVESINNRKESVKLNEEYLELLDKENELKLELEKLQN